MTDNVMDATSFLNQVKNTITTYQMLQSGDKVLVAVSGGPDSSALLRTLVELAPEYRLELGIFHLNHGLRAGAADEAEHVAQVSREFGIPIYARHADVRAFCAAHGLGIQEGARTVRYKLMREIAHVDGFAKIAVGHTADDVVETFFMRLIRGSGLTGLSSIPPVRDGDIIRPLIDTVSHRIVEFLELFEDSYIIDPSNTEQKYLRNRIRNGLLPKLAEFNPRISERVISTVRLIREEESLISQIAENTFSRVAVVDGAEVRIDLAALRQLNAALGRRVVRRAIAIVGQGRDIITFDHLNAIWNGLVCGNDRALDLPGKMRVLKESGLLVVHSEPCPIPITEVKPGEKIRVSGLAISVKIKPRAEIEHLAGDQILTDADRIEWPLTIRSAIPGDSFQPLGLDGTKKIHRYFIDAKIPRRRRPTVPVFVDGKKVVAVGPRVDERAKVTDKTRDVVVIEIAHTRVTAEKFSGRSEERREEGRVYEERDRTNNVTNEVLGRASRSFEPG